jgi:hypothetical protein
MIRSFKAQTIFFACVLVLIALNCQAQSADRPRRPQDLRLASMSAKLFYETSGTFSQDVFTNQVNLWNTTIEGASREGASESMLVTIEIKAEGEGWVPTGRKVQLTARYRIADASGLGKPVFFSRTMKINIGSENKFFAGFWLYETGCHPVELTARIVGQKQRLRKTINLGCGE